jgi:threonine/homoserine/homoserine lactone efflux protein
MDWSLFPRGLLIGLSVAIPVGPMALLCMRRTLAFGFGAGFTSGVGVATADAIYGAVAAFGLTSISSFLVDFQDIVRFGGGLFLIYLGIGIFRSHPAQTETAAPLGTLRGAGAFASTLGLTLTNPTTILSFAAIFSGFGIAAKSDGADSATALVLGVFLGSVFWWLILVTGVGRLRGWLTGERLSAINRACGVAIGTFGILALWGAIR